jgi:hypothetical protein
MGSLNQMRQTRIEIRVDKKSSFESLNPAENPVLAHFNCHMYVFSLYMTSMFYFCTEQIYSQI